MTFVRPLLAALAAALAGASAPGLAQPQAQTQLSPVRPAASAAAAPKPLLAGPAPKRIDYCEKRAGDRTGDARRNHVQACLKTGTTQQNKMKACNVAAKGKRGDERRAFMSQCLRKKPA